MCIFYVDRKTGERLKESVEGEAAIKFLYGQPLVGKTLLELAIKKWMSKGFGKLQDTRYSAKKIEKFVRKHDIDLSEAEETSFDSFNAFFTRRLKPASRPIDPFENHLIAPADGRLLVYQNIDIDHVIQVKGIDYALKDLLTDPDLANRYQNGICMVIRLCPTDYHRYHFPFDCEITEEKAIDGKYYSVNPIALEKIPSLYVQNKRAYQVLKSPFFGHVVMMAVGATFVGTIFEHFSVGDRGIRGEEKGYFKFGGSTLILFFESNSVCIDADLIENTHKGLETKVLMGEKIGIASA